ncbi:hypothetical protein DFH06DRAFT_1345551 [Mycena polygramma]|nr:hypothetical protein DFH06DRAFT_1345551 [Mycena polygramma]
MIPEIPQELIDASLDFVTESDLLQCSLVSHAWLPLAQSRIFHTITLGAGVQGGMASGLMEYPPLCDHSTFWPFHDLLQAAPHLAYHIHRLNLGLPPSASEPASESLDHTPLSAASWQSIEDSLVEYLPLLPNLEALALFPCGSDIHTFHLQPRMMEIFGQLSIRSLAFSRWAFTDSTTLPSFAVQPTSLRFIECEFKTRLLPIDRDLTSLEYCHCEGFTAFSLPRADHITLYLAEDSTPRILHRIAPSTVKSLTVAFDAYHEHYVPVTWLEAVFASLVLKQGLTFHVLFKGVGNWLSTDDWDRGLRKAMNVNHALHLLNRVILPFVGSDDVDYTFVSVPS